MGWDDDPRCRELEARLEVLTGFTGGILFEFDRDGRYLEVRTGEPELLVRPAEELIGRTVTEVFGAEGERVLTVLRSVTDTGEPASFEYAMEVLAGRRWFRGEARRTPRGEGEPPGVTLLVRDITHETELRAKLVQAERLAAVGLLAASVGHEIRQPLAFATTSLEVVVRELGPGATRRAQEALAHVRDALERIAQIAASVGVVAADRRRATTTHVLRPLEAALDLCASELKERARVDIRIGELPLVLVNEGELCQVFSNLLLNAAQSMIPSGGRRTMPSLLTVSAAREGNAVRVSIRDTGRGIAAEDLARIFDPFFTTKEPGRGTGLGLYVSKRIVEANGGRLEVRSRVGEGTTVDVVLQVAEATEPPPASVAAGAAARRLKVLVVDDEPAFLRSLELVLEDTHDVVVCDRSVQALALVTADPERFDAILCDLSMPEMDGVAFFDEVARLGLAQRFVLMTAGAFTARAEEFLHGAKCRRIGKPFTLDKLLAILDAVASKRSRPQT